MADAGYLLLSALANNASVPARGRFATTHGGGAATAAGPVMAAVPWEPRHLLRDGTAAADPGNRASALNSSVQTLIAGLLSEQSVPPWGNATVPASTASAPTPTPVPGGGAQNCSAGGGVGAGSGGTGGGGNCTVLSPGLACATAAAVAGPDGAELNWPALLFLLVVVLTVGGNLLVILAVWLEKKLQTATNYFLMSLAVADLLVGLTVMPISVINILYNMRWPLPCEMCPVWVFLDVLFSTASIMHLCAISLDRYIAIKRPIQHSRFNSRSKTLLKITAVWAISIGIASPIPVLGLQDQQHVFVNGACILNIQNFIIYGSVVSFFLPLLIMVVIYVLTIRLLRGQVGLMEVSRGSSSVSAVTSASTRRGSEHQRVIFRHKETLERLPTLLDGERLSAVGGAAAAVAASMGTLRRTQAAHSRSAQALSNERRASKVLGIVFTLFLVMWCPFFVTNVTSALCPESLCSVEAMAKLMDIFVWVGYVSSGVNPLVYTLFNQTYRQAFRRYVACDFRRARHRSSSKELTQATVLGSRRRASLAPNGRLHSVDSAAIGVVGAGHHHNGHRHRRLSEAAVSQAEWCGVAALSADAAPVARHVYEGTSCV
uniref:5-hydroxytryptamine receptor 2B n=2 Tax=Petromyzon marinus TaxID=7757 RepID=A0AAJ7U492_PETMA|nr:5-hydroxytryptamine receptor 2B-like [Petromyzon marinus]XP_032828018.1 5-hydroxytryptamine receptor 2B-like [Petromyzon marinus]